MLIQNKATSLTIAMMVVEVQEFPTGETAQFISGSWGVPRAQKGAWPHCYPCLDRVFASVVWMLDTHVLGAGRPAALRNPVGLLQPSQAQGDQRC